MHPENAPQQIGYHECKNHRLCRHHTTTNKQENEHEREQMSIDPLGMVQSVFLGIRALTKKLDLGEPMLWDGFRAFVNEHIRDLCDGTCSRPILSDMSGADVVGRGSEAVSRVTYD